MGFRPPSTGWRAVVLDSASWRRQADDGSAVAGARDLPKPLGMRWGGVALRRKRYGDTWGPA